MGSNVLQFLVSFEARRRRVCAYSKSSFLSECAQLAQGKALRRQSLQEQSGLQGREMESTLRGT